MDGWREERKEKARRRSRNDGGAKGWLEHRESYGRWGGRQWDRAAIAAVPPWTHLQGDDEARGADEGTQGRAGRVLHGLANGRVAAGDAVGAARRQKDRTTCHRQAHTVSRTGETSELKQSISTERRPRVVGSRQLQKKITVPASRRRSCSCSCSPQHSRGHVTQREGLAGAGAGADRGARRRRHTDRSRRRGG